MLIAGDISESIIGAAIDVHRVLGPGLLESVYEECFCVELEERQIPFDRQVGLPVVYKGRTLDVTLRMDVVVSGQVVVEIKSVETLLPVHEAQLLTYLKLSGKRVGLLMNFNVSTMRSGIVRRIL